MDIINLLEEEVKLNIIIKTIRAIEEKKYKGVKEEREGVYSAPEYKTIIDVLESKDLPYGYRGCDFNGAIYTLDFFEGRKTNMLKVKAKATGEQWDLIDFLGEDPERLNINWISNNTRDIKILNDKYWTTTDVDLWNQLVVADNGDIFVVDLIQTCFTYWGQSIDMPKAIKVLEGKSI